MKVTRYAVVGTAAGIVLGLAAVLVFARTPEPLAVETAANAGRGPGIPPAPGASQNAPPEPNPQASTANLKKVANALHLNHKSVTVVVTLPAGLGVTNRVDVSVLFGTGAQSKRITQSYNNSSGNRIVHNFPANDGQRRREEVTISLLEAMGNGEFTPSAVRSTVDLEPLYDIGVGSLFVELVNDCDDIGESEPHVYFRLPNGKKRDSEMSMSGGETEIIGRFAQLFTEVGQSANLNFPTFQFVEEDLYMGAVSRNPVRPFRPLLPGRSQTVAFEDAAGNESICTAKFRYSLTYTLRQYPNL